MSLGLHDPLELFPQTLGQLRSCLDFEVDDRSLAPQANVTTEEFESAGLVSELCSYVVLIPCSKEVWIRKGNDCQFVEHTVGRNLYSLGLKLHGCFDSYLNDWIAKILRGRDGRRPGAVPGADCRLGSVQIDQVLFDKALLLLGQVLQTLAFIILVLSYRSGENQVFLLQ